MAREYDLQGLDKNTRRKTANRPFEDIKGTKSEIPAYHQIEVPKKPVEENATVKPAQKRKLYEEPPAKARLTIRERTRKFGRTGVSLADE